MDKLNQFLDFFGFISEDRKISITNFAVIIFCTIAAFRSLFPGLEIHTSYFTWKVQGLDIASTLPLLFSLLNYGHKRSTIAELEKPTTQERVQ